MHTWDSEALASYRAEPDNCRMVGSGEAKIQPVCERERQDWGSD
jgi:hypothetical protein